MSLWNTGGSPLLLTAETAVIQLLTLGAEETVEERKSIHS